MNAKELQDILDKNNADEMIFKGLCHDCGKEVAVCAGIHDDAPFASGGSVYKVPPPSIREDNLFLKCEECFGKDRVLRSWRKTEVYSRVSGYLRPVQQWNKGKKTEWEMRKVYKM